MNKNSLIVYFSPGGSTRLTAETIAESLKTMNHRADFLDLSSRDNDPDPYLKQLDTYDCIWIGSPVYANHPIPPIMDFISSLPERTDPGPRAALFVTYGGVTSGVALFEMGQALASKGYPLLGGAKILAVHSMMWPYENPIAEGRPNEEDLNALRDLVTSIVKCLGSETESAALVPEALNYQPPKNRDIAKERSLELLKNIMPPIELARELCTECGLCQDRCPTQNITLNPYPQFGNNCVLCLNCVHYCEPGALTNDVFKILDTELRKRADVFQEPFQTEIFLPSRT